MADQQALTPIEIMNKKYVDDGLALKADKSVTYTKDDINTKLTGFDADTVDGKHALDLVQATDVVTTATPQKILKLDSNSQLPTSITGNANTASKLQTARTLSTTGDISGSVSFDGSKDITIDAELVNTGVVAGNYAFIKVDAKGRTLQGSNTNNTNSDINMGLKKITNLSDATLNTDATSLGQVNTLISNATSGLASSLHTPVADLAAAKAVTAVQRQDKMLMNIEALGLYRWDAEATGTSDDNTIIRPTDIAADTTAGRWVKMNSTINSHNTLDSIQGGTTGDYQHLTSAQVTKVNNASQNGHIHAISDVTNLQASLDNKAPISHVSVIGGTSIGHVKNGGNVVIDTNGNMNVSIPTNADTVDNYHAGNTSGNVAVNNGTVNVNLNADMLDGLHSGNANGNVAINNGTVNNNLNADMLDGLHASAFAPVGYGLGTMSTDISSKNLNDYQTTGFFKGSSVVNAPNSGWFWFVIQAHDGSNWTSQIAVSFGASNTQNIMYTRTNSQGTWSSWSQIAKISDIPTTLPANGGNSDTVDNCHAGNANGNVAINNGTVNVNLNADMLDNLNAGNANGNVAVNNGTVNNNLNADMLDGNHSSAFVPASHTSVIGSTSIGHVKNGGNVVIDSAGNMNVSIPTTLPANGGNADTLDGYHAGNSSGNIPINNGNININLNADMLDGFNVTDLDNKYIQKFILPTGTGTAKWYKIAEYITNVGSGESGYLFYVQGASDFGSQTMSLDIVQGSGRSSAYMRILRAYSGSSPASYGYIVNSSTGKTEIWIGLTGYSYATTITVAAANGVTFGNFTNQTAVPNGIMTIAPIKLGDNDTGNIPISNGTINLNLNADMLDGNHSSAFASASHSHTASQVSGLATVATSGSYNDLSNKPTIPTTLPANGGNSNTVGGYTPGNANGNVAINNITVNTNLNADMLDGNHSSAFAPASHNHTASQVSGLATVATSGSYNDLNNKPTIPTIPSSLPANGGNSNTVGGYAPGNSSGNIPINNGTANSNLNADMLDGKHASDLVINSAVGSIDFNTITQTGVYRLSANNTNAPSADWGQLLVLHGGGDTIAQIAFDYASHNVYVRSGNPSNVGGSGSWNAWSTMWNAYNQGSGSGLDADSVDGIHSSNLPYVVACNNGGWTVQHGMAIGDNTAHIDAALHIRSAYGGNGRLTQMAPSTPSTAAFNLIASLDANSNGQWWSWGVGTDNNFYINSGLGFNTNGIRIDASGGLTAGKIYGAVYNDYAELFEKEEILEPGDVVIKSSNKDGYEKSKISYDKKVIGVVSDTYGHILGGDKDKSLEENLETYTPIGLSGRIKVKVIGDIEIGDLLVTSNIPGVAMKDKQNQLGTIIGKALQTHTGSDIDRIEMLIINM